MNFHDAKRLKKKNLDPDSDPSNRVIKWIVPRSYTKIREFVIFTGATLASAY